MNYTLLHSSPQLSFAIPPTSTSVSPSSHSYFLCVEFCQKWLPEGADPEVEEGGAHIEWGWCGHAARAARGIFFFFFFASAVSSLLEGSGGMLP